jgi:molybdate/tungstate transport system ATP-binding protein
MLLLDEPLAALDTNMRGRLRGMLRRINRDTGVTVLHVTHDPVEAMAVADKVGVMLDNRLVQVGGVDDLFRRPSNAEVSRFLGMSNVLRVDSVSDEVCMVCGESIHASGAVASVEHIWIGVEEIILSDKPFDSSARNQLLCNVVDWESRDLLLAVNVRCGDLNLTSLITYRSFGEIGIEVGKAVYATFKSSAVRAL